jgi:hypothetical protein
MSSPPLDDSDTSSDYVTLLRNDLRWRNLLATSTGSPLSEDQVNEAFAYLHTKWHPRLPSPHVVNSSDAGNSSPDLLDSLNRDTVWATLVRRTTSPTGNSNANVKSAFRLLQDRSKQIPAVSDSTPPANPSESEPNSTLDETPYSSGTSYTPSIRTPAHYTQSNGGDSVIKARTTTSHQSANESDAEDAAARALGKECCTSIVCHTNAWRPVVTRRSCTRSSCHLGACGTGYC